MSLPAPLQDAIERTVRELGLGERIAWDRPVAGGCIHNGTCVGTDAGRTLFLKWSVGAPAGMFEAEVDGLRALRATAAARVPEPLGWGDGDDGAAWLLMEYVDPGPTGPGAARALGEALARVHAAGREQASFGWCRDNWIGTLPQLNEPSDDWGSFWRDARLAPQLERARSGGRLREPVFDRVLELTRAALASVQDRELLHGDLWSGNTFTDEDGRPVLIDPAVAVGDGEVDLAMSDLFGGFGLDFRAAYRASRGVSDEYDAYKRDLYQLYYLLVHVNLFGGAYEAGSRAAAGRVAAALDS